MDIERRIGPDIEATILTIARSGDQGSDGCTSAIATYTQGKGEHVTTILLGGQKDFGVGDQIKMTPIWKHFTNSGVLTEFSLAQDQL